METNDREPKYLGTHRGVARVQIGWTTLYFRGDAYTHALGSLYGTQESPTREEITAARKVIPVVPRPPVMANAPSTGRAASRKAESASGKPAAKPPEGARQAKAAKRSRGAPSEPKASTTKRLSAKGKAAGKSGTRTPRPPAKEKTPRGEAAPKKAARSGNPKPAEGKAMPVEKSPIATMADLVARIETPAGRSKAPKEKGIGSMAELEAQLS